MRIAVVTGGARGIGSAIVETLAADGCHVESLDIDDEAGESVVARLRARGLDAGYRRCDVTVRADVDSTIAAVVSDHGGIDILVNNAGRNAYHDAHTMTEDEWDDVFAVDLKAAWLLARAAIPHLVERHGSIVNISSIHGRLTVPGMFPYAAAKSAVEGLTRSLALDYARDGVRVNAVAPGWTRTDLVDEWMARQPDGDAALAAVERAHPLGRIAEPGDVAAVVAFLASPAARAVTGAVWAVDCGLSAQFRVDGA